MDDCCSGKSDELLLLKAKQAHILKIVMAINLLMFLVEFGSAWLASSTSLMADSLDMLGDAIVYGFSLYVLHKSQKIRASAALLKGIIMVTFGLSVLIQGAIKLGSDALPSYESMGWIGGLALLANTLCLVLLYRHRDDDINMKSTWICSRNDIISNLGVLIAAGLVASTQTKWPDLLVGLLIAILFLRSAIPILLESITQLRSPS